MMCRSLILLLFVAAIAHCAPATDENQEVSSEGDVATERFANLSSLTLPGANDLSFNGSSLMQILVSGGAIVLAFVGLIAVLALLAPIFGFKSLCYLLGTCGDQGANGAYMAGSALANGVAQAYDAYHTFNQPTSGYTASPTYQRRSLAYFGPILKTLNNAFEKYESLASTPVKKE